MSTSARVRIFEHDWLERLSRATPRTLAVFWLPVAAAGLAGGIHLGLTWPWLVAAAPVTILAWSLFEYAMHRCLFHAKLPGALGARMNFIIHGCHHVDPSDATRNVMPLSVTIPVGVVLFGVIWSIFPLPLALFVGGVFGLSYLAYDLLHWRLHQRTGGGRIERFLRRQHMQHHFAHQHAHFGVTSPLWDRVFGTSRPS